MFRKRRKTSDFDAEIEAHLQLEAERLQEQGMSESEARMAARRAFGNRTLARERFYESRRWRWWDVLAQDIRFGLRMMARNPVSSIVAILILAVGIGANTAIFSMVDALLLRNLPVRQPQQLSLFGQGQAAGTETDLPNRSWQLFSYPFYRELQQRNTVFSSIAAIDSIQLLVHGRVGSDFKVEKLGVELVSGTYFQTLGVKPLLGAAFNKADDRVPGGAPIAVASYAWWHRRSRNDSAAIGTKVTIGSTVYSIIGIAPRGFFGMTVGRSPNLWIPLAMEKQISPGWNGSGLHKKWVQSLYIVGRRRPGVGAREASANTNLLFKQILREYVGPHPSPRQLQEIRHARIDLTSAATGLSPIRHQYSRLLKILMAVVALVLLIACANIANLLLARAAARRRELATRISVGAGRWRLIRQLLIESALLGLAGAGLGIALAWEASRLLLWMVSDTPGQPLPLRVTPDLHVLGFTLAATMLTVLLFGMAPAFYATRLDLISSLKEGRGMTAGRGRNRLARGLIAGQIALSLALLVASGLFLHSLVNL
ncbi:MAG: ABC transporter permease, partial [Bryobacteraceae bacterium]